MAEISLGDYCEQIESTIEQGRFAEAVAHGKHILKRYPKHVTTYQLLGKVMLETGQHEYAADMFRRVLSADPENLVAWVGMSEVYSQRGELDAAAWYLERAFELAADNEVVEEELRRLYGQRDGVEPERIQLTRSALARLYLKGDLLPRAISEFRALLAEHPERVEMIIALAEALWRNEQRLEASEVCQQALNLLPYCLKANLILGEIWTSSGREEGQTYLQRAKTLDPENRMAQELFGTASPLLAREVQITPLGYERPTEEERPAWMARVEAAPAEGVPPAEGEAVLFDITSALETQIEIPSWLEEVVGEEAPAAAPPPPAAAEPLEEQPPEEVVPVPAEEAPDWLASVDEVLVEERPEAVTEEEVPEWLAGLGLEPISEEQVPEQPPELMVEPTGVEEVLIAPEEEKVPEWLAGLGLEPIGEEEVPEGLAEPMVEPAGLEPLGEEEVPEEPAEPMVEPARIEEVPAVLGEEEIPEWLAELGIEAPEEKMAAEIAAAEQPSDWLADIRDQFIEEAEIPPEATAPMEALPREELPPAAEEEAPMPAWLEEEGLPSGDEALAWLEELAAGKEDELRARAEAEAEARLAEIMGRPTPAGPAAMEAPPEELPPTTPPPVPAEIPDWLQELAPPEAVAPEVAPPAVEPVPEEITAPPVEEPFGWTAFGEPEAPPELVTPTEEAVPAAEEEAPMPAWLEEEGLPSGDEALAWLEQLAAGKEDELRAQAEAETEARLAEIMGRPMPAEAPAVEAPPEEAIAPPVEEAIAAAEEAPLVEEAIPVAEKEVPIPAWLEEEGLPSGDEALAWLEQLAAGKEDELRAQAEAEAEARLAEIMGRPGPAEAPPVEAPPEEVVAPPVEEVAAAPVEEPFGWTAFGEPEAPPEATVAVEEAPPVEKVVPEEIVAPPVEEPVAPPVEFPVAEEAPSREVAPPIKEVHWDAVVEAPPEEIVPTPVVEEVPGVVEMEVEEPFEEIIPPPEAPAVEVPAEPFAAERAHLKQHPRDYEAWLALARELWQAGERDEALEAYTRVIRSGKLLESVTPDLEQYVEQWPAVDVQQALGDAYMKDGQLQKALDTYRQALEAL